MLDILRLLGFWGSFSYKKNVYTIQKKIYTERDFTQIKSVLSEKWRKHAEGNILMHCNKV